jgi:hypothetical protein
MNRISNYLETTNFKYFFMPNHINYIEGPGHPVEENICGILRTYGNTKPKCSFENCPIKDGPMENRYL